MKKVLPLTLTICFTIICIVFICKRSFEMKKQYTPPEQTTIVEKDPINYDDYLRKVWIREDWNYKENFYDFFSFSIIKIDNGTIEGIYSTRTEAFPEFYHTEFRESKYIDNFCGTIKDNTAKFYIENSRYQSILVQLLFVSDEKIEVTIDYNYKEYEYDKHSFFEGKFTYKPYKLKDDFYIFLDKFPAEINSWGDVNVIVTKSEISSPASEYATNYAVIYFADKNDNLLYQIIPNAATRIINSVDIVVEKINEDNLKDLRLTINSGEEGIVLYQMENGLFYDYSICFE